MREIKYRVYDEKGRKMLSFDVLQRFALLGLIFTEENQYKAMQYTGLKDKNGVEIYEGDIVFDRWANAYTPVFQNGIYMAYNADCLYLTKQDPSTQFNIIWKDGCEVIGNIYENPELLETKKD